jgi:O-antigen ligase
MFFALSYTYSRGSLLSLSIALLYYLFKKKIKLFTLKRVILFTISVPFLILFLFLRGLSFESSTFERFGQLSHDASFFARWAIITDVWNISQSFGAKIILGLGTGASNGIRYLTGGALDNQYLNIYYENGLIAIILVVLLFIGVLRKKADIVFKAAIVGIIFNMTTYEIFYYSSAGTMIWLLMGVVTSQTRAAVKSKANIEDTNVNYISEKKKRKTKRKYRIVL